MKNKILEIGISLENHIGFIPFQQFKYTIQNSLGGIKL